MLFNTTYHVLLLIKREDYIYRDHFTSGADESKSDGAPSDVNYKVCYCLINYKEEIICDAWAPGSLQEDHLKDKVKQMIQLKSSNDKTTVNSSEIFVKLPERTWTTLL